MVFSGSLAPCLGSYSFRKSSQQSVRGLRPLPAYSALPEPTEKRPEPDAVALVPALVLTDASESVLSESVQETPLEAFWRSYLTLLEEKPILVKSMTSFFGFMIGDLCAQFIMGGDYDLLRTIRLTLFGVLMDGPIGHCWYLLLDQNVFPESPTEPKAVVTKTLLDQLAWAPFFSCVFFTFNQTLQGHPGTSLAVIRKTLVPTLTANWTLWPLAHIINFKFVPSNQRILYINFVQILWTSYLSNLANQHGQGGRVYKHVTTHGAFSRWMHHAQNLFHVPKHTSHGAMSHLMQHTHHLGHHSHHFTHFSALLHKLMA